MDKIDAIRKLREQVEAVEDAHARFMVANAVGCPDLFHKESQRLSTALFAVFCGGPEPDEEPCLLNRVLAQAEARALEAQEGGE